MGHGDQLRGTLGPPRLRRPGYRRDLFLHRAHRHRRHRPRRHLRGPDDHRPKRRLDKVSAKFDKPAIDRSGLFCGPKAYEQLFNSKDVDALYIATPPFFHPAQLEAAIAAGKHTYLEKPVGVDVPGCQKVAQLGEQAGRQDRAWPSGFQIRHASAYVEMVKRIHDGQMGKPVSGLINYFASALDRPDTPAPAAEERRLRNWVWDRVLSGDIIVEQNIHVIDVTNWVLDGHPIKRDRGRRTGRADGRRRLLEPLQRGLHLRPRRPHRPRLHAVRQLRVGGQDAVLRDRRRRGGQLRLAGPDRRRQGVGVPRASGEPEDVGHETR